jgi:hypothetical protein
MIEEWFAELRTTGFALNRECVSFVNVLIFHSIWILLSFVCMPVLLEGQVT